MSQLTKLHELNGKLDMINDLKISDLNLSLDQQQKLLYTHQQVLDERFELLKKIKKDYIL
jgi:hypothetical protein